MALCLAGLLAGALGVAMAADDTRPISADSSIGANPNGYPKADNFTSLEHYTNGFGVYTDKVTTTTTRPFGVGEFIWSADNSKAGLVWFGTSTMALRPAHAAMRAWTARLLTARGRPRDTWWTRAKASSENKVSARPAIFRWWAT